MRRRLILALALLCLAVWSAGCSLPRRETPPAAGERVLVMATIFPVYDFARQVGGDRVEVRLMVPPGAEPHDWEPTPQDLAALSQAKVFIYSGAGLEPWVNKVLSGNLRKDAVVVEASQGVDLYTAPDGHTDPHVWLDPDNARKMVNNIRDGLVAADAAHKTEYEQNAAAYVKQLIGLDAAYRDALAHVARRDFVTSHAAFGYLARRYGLNQIPIMGLAPDAEPTPETMAGIVRLVREQGIKYIFFETLVSPKLSQTIARETGASTLVLNPLEGLSPQEMAQGKNYLTVMHDNLVNLVRALQ